MHRSGTSCLAGTLEEAGVNLGDVSTNNVFNKKGNRENTDIMSLNDDLLAHNNASWDSPPKSKLIWNDSHIERANKLIFKISTDEINKFWGFKDPRVLLTYPFWKEVFPKAILLGTIRNPADVAASLNRRDKDFSIQKGLTLWLDYNTNLLSLLKEKPFPLISFDEKSDMYRNKTKEILTEILPYNSQTQRNNFFESSLRSPVVESIKLSKEVKDCYQELQSYLT